jgi:hypothetical protein
MRASSKILLGSMLVVALAVGVWMATRRAKAPESPPVDVPVEPAPRIPAPRLPPPSPPAVDASPPARPLPAAKKVGAPKPKLLTEAELLDKLRKAQDTDAYLLSYDLAREGLRRFPKSQDAPEMAAMVVKSLARQGKISEARAEAEEMVNKYAGTFWAREVERHTGAHPIRNQVPPK